MCHDDSSATRTCALSLGLFARAMQEMGVGIDMTKDGSEIEGQVLLRELSLLGMGTERLSPTKLVCAITNSGREVI